MAKRDGRSSPVFRVVAGRATVSLLVILLAFIYLATSARGDELARGPRPPASRPNIIFILADDLGYGEVGVLPAKSPHGRIRTPNIDQLAREGMLFTDAYAGEAVCAPSRCTLMTGLHTGHAPIRGNKKVNGKDFPLPQQTATVAEVLQDAGYYTAAIGKWALGFNDTTGAPRQKGFNYYYGQLDQTECHNYYPPAIWENERQIKLPQNENASRERCMSPNNDCVYINTLFANKALEFLGAQAKQPSTDPFFLYLAFTVPHAGGWQGVAESGAPVPSDGIYSNESWPDVERDHASMITTYLDDYVGTVMQLLRKTGLDNDTIVFFASDNGAHNEGGHNYLFFDSSGPLRGFKRSLYEGGIRSPSIVRWPGVVPAGSVSSFAWAFWDFLATAADLAGVVPENLPETDGISIVPTLLGKQQPPHDYLYWEFCVNSNWGHAVRTGPWKAVSFALSEPLQLYNITVDIHEDHNIAEEYPNTLAVIRDMAAEAHTENPNWPRHC